jgi:hypothetical protein
MLKALAKVGNNISKLRSKQLKITQKNTMHA